MVSLMTSSSGTVSWRVLCLRWRDILSTCSVTYIECSSASRRTELCIYVEFTFNWEAVSQRILSERFSWIAVRGKNVLLVLRTNWRSLLQMWACTQRSVFCYNSRNEVQNRAESMKVLQTLVLELMARDAAPLPRFRLSTAHSSTAVKIIPWKNVQVVLKLFTSHSRGSECLVAWFVA